MYLLMSSNLSKSYSLVSSDNDNVANVIMQVEMSDKIRGVTQ